jgi:hypothetical protein
MIDNLFTAAIALCVLIGGTLAIGSAFSDRPAPTARVVQPTFGPQHQAAVAAGAYTEASKPALR